MLADQWQALIDQRSGGIVLLWTIYGALNLKTVPSISRDIGARIRFAPAMACPLPARWPRPGKNILLTPVSLGTKSKEMQEKDCPFRPDPC